MKQTNSSGESPRKGTVIVSVSQPVVWSALKEEGIPSPRTFISSVGRRLDRVTVALSEPPWKEGDGPPLNLKIGFLTGMCGYQEADGPVTVEQALVFEESVRAVFSAARARGLLPAAKPLRKTRRS